MDVLDRMGIEAVGVVRRNRWLGGEEMLVIFEGMELKIKDLVGSWFE